MEKMIKVNIINESVGVVDQWDYMNHLVGNPGNKLRRMAKKAAQGQDHIFFEVEVSAFDAFYNRITSSLLRGIIGDDDPYPGYDISGLGIRGYRYCDGGRDSGPHCYFFDSASKASIFIQMFLKGGR